MACDHSAAFPGGVAAWIFKGGVECPTCGEWLPKLSEILGVKVKLDPRLPPGTAVLRRPDGSTAVRIVNLGAEDETMEQREQKPSVGRIVHYQAFGTPGGEYPSVPRAAIITQVSDDLAGVVGLAILNPTGMFFNQTVPYSETPKPGCWSWPPRVNP